MFIADVQLNIRKVSVEGSSKRQSLSDVAVARTLPSEPLLVGSCCKPDQLREYERAICYLKRLTVISIYWIAMSSSWIERNS